MGVLYSITPVSAFSKDDDIGIDIKPYLRDASRSPSIAELEHIVGSSTDCVVEWFDDHNDTKVASITHTREGEDDSRTTLVIMNYSNVDKQGYYFEKGDRDLLIDFVHRISKICGSQVIYPDSGGSPVLVDPRLSPPEALQIWKNQNG